MKSIDAKSAGMLFQLLTRELKN